MATDDWQVNGTAGWTDSADWSTGSVPASGDDVLIGLNSHAATVKSAADVTIHTLEITSGDTLDLNGGNFNVTDGLPFGMFGFIDVDSANFQIDGGTINNSATIDLTPSGNITTDLTIFNTVQLNGAGSIVFAGNGNDGILGGSPSAKLTNFDNNISGTGFIEGLVFINLSTIETNNSLGAGTLRIVGSAYGGSFDNENSLFADNGGTIELGDWAGTASSTILDDDGAISLLSTGAVTTLEIANSVTITTTFGDGLIGLDGTDPANDRIISNGSTASLTLGAHMTVLNTGTIGDANLTLVNEGDIFATGRTLVINTGANTIVNGFGGELETDSMSGGACYLDIQSGVQNSGTIAAGTNGLVTIDRASTNNSSGVIAVGNGGEIIVDSSIFGLNGSEIEIGSGGLFDLRPGGTVSQGVEFTGSGGPLELEQDAGQIGTSIAGLSAGDGIYLKFLNFAAGDHAVWTQTSGGKGTISVLAANGSLLATLVVEGTWNSQDFTVTDDGGGTLVAAGSPSYAENPGNNDEWVMADGHWVASAGPGSHPSGYNVAGIGDWTGNGTDGILWYNPSTGDADEWQLSNTQWSASIDLGTHPGNFQIAGVGDFNGDGISDVLWTSASGGAVQTDIWELASHGQWMASVSPGAHPAGYTVAGIGDWTGNGTDGILWYDASTGDTDEWQLNNGQWAASVDLGHHPGNYQIAGVGDFNDDGTSDVLWTSVNADGTIATDIWELNSSGKWMASVSPGNHPAGYSVVGVGDFTGTGTSDILWYNASTGDTDEWLINNGQWAGSIDLGSHPGNFQIAGAGDFSGAGTKGILWHAPT